MSKEKELRISFCPKCKSRDVRYVFELGNLFGIIPKMKCFECGFESVSFPVLVTTESKLKKAVSKMKKKVKRKGVKK
jgi:Zn ribbon nucleic-acid-binding protein